MERWWNDFKLVWLAKRVRPKSMAELEQSIQQAIKYFNTERAYASKNGLRLGENDGFLTSLVLVLNYYKDNVRNQ